MAQMINMKLQKVISRLALVRKLKRAEHEIGYRLGFKEIPDFWISGLMMCDMTRTWKNSGLKISRGANYFTIGKIKNGISSRFDFKEPQYQSWLGGYTVKLKKGREWTLQDHLNLAVADQKSWLRRYGDPNPLCDMREVDFRLVGSLNLNKYTGKLYEGGCTTHSDVGDGYASLWLRLSAMVMAGVLNISNPHLNLYGNSLRPRAKGGLYEILKLKGYIAIFDIEKDVKVVLYGNGIIGRFEMIKNEIYRAMSSCEIVKI